MFLGTLCKLLNAAAGVDHLCCAGIKRMAIAADFYSDFGHGCPTGPGVAARAFHDRLGEILGMYASLHIAILLYFCYDVQTCYGADEPMTNASPIPSYEDMIKAGMHFGRKKSIFHPNMRPFVFTAKEHIYILDLIKTAESLQRIIDTLKEVIAQGKMVLFVGITKQSAEVVKKTAESLGMPYVIERWLGGTLTNFKVITARVKHLESMEAELAAGGFGKYTKKERILKEREMASLRQKYDGLRKLTKLPDMIFVSSVKESQLPIREARQLNTPTIGIVNTDSDPAQVTHAIPANDNARKSVELILEAITQSCQSIPSKNSAS